MEPDKILTDEKRYQLVHRIVNISTVIFCAFYFVIKNFVDSPKWLLIPMLFFLVNLALIIELKYHLRRHKTTLSKVKNRWMWGMGVVNVGFIFLCIINSRVFF